MKLKLVGMVLIMMGFAIPFVLMKIVPTFLYAAVLSKICFWIGFLTILSPINTNSIYKPYLRWARYAVLVNVVLAIFAVAFYYLFFYFDLRKPMGFFLMRLLGFLANPIQSVFDFVVAKPMVQQPDGSVLVTTSFIRALLTDFFNIPFYCCLGIFARIIIEKKITSASSRPLIDRRGC